MSFSIQPRLDCLRVTQKEVLPPVSCYVLQCWHFHRLDSRVVSVKVYARLTKFMASIASLSAVYNTLNGTDLPVRIIYGSTNCTMETGALAFKRKDSKKYPT